MVGDRRQGWAILAAMTIVFVALLAVAAWAEQPRQPGTREARRRSGRKRRCSRAATWKARRRASASSNSALWATATTAASNGSVNAMHDSFTPLGGLVPMWLMQLGEVIFGGVGSGLYGMLVFAIVAVFVAGLMIGRTPEYLGKKIEAFEIKMAAIVILVPPLVVLGGTAVAVVADAGQSERRQSRRARLLRDPLRVFLRGQQQRQRLRGAVREHALLQHRARLSRCCSSRYWLIVPVLAIAGSLAAKKTVPAGPGRCPRTRRCSSCF